MKPPPKPGPLRELNVAFPLEEPATLEAQERVHLTQAIQVCMGQLGGEDARGLAELAGIYTDAAPVERARMLRVLRGGWGG